MIQDVILYGGIYNHSLVTTTDATPTVIALREIEDATAGMMIIDVNAVLTNGTVTNVGRYGVKYSKIGTTTIGTVTTIFEDNDSTISINVVADSDENLTVEATGIAATEINWIARTQILEQQFTALP